MKRSFGVKRLALAGAVALALAVGSIGAVATGAADTVLAQSNEIEFEGAIEALPDTGLIGNWQVAGRTVVVTDTTEIDTEGKVLAVGLLVEVEGVPQADGSILASEIEVEDDD